MPHDSSEPGDRNPRHPPLLRASESLEQGSEPAVPDAEPAAPLSRTVPPDGEPPTVPVASTEPPTAPPAPALLPAGTPPPPRWSPHGGASSAPPVPPRAAPPAHPQWRRGLAAAVVALMVLVAGALLGSSTRGGLLFSDGSSSSSNPVVPRVPSDASSINPNDDDASGAADAVRPGIVTILTTIRDPNSEASAQGAGTGMIISSSGEVLTNNHVIENADEIEVELADGTTTSATVLGYDVHDDVALLQLEDGSRFDTIPIGDPTATDISDPIVVVGNALGQGVQVTPGTVTGLDRQITATDANGYNAETLTGLIQVAADVKPGDSGGALASSDGKVIGMTTAASTTGWRFREDTAGVGFAIPIDIALSIVEQIRNNEEVDGVHVGPRALLGVQLEASDRFGGGGGSADDGALVTRVTDDSPAADAGIEAGDLIVGVGDTEVRSNDDLQDALNTYHPDDRVKVTWSDGAGNTESATVKLIEGPPA
jgi:S1-C subfamily serine protease